MAKKVKELVDQVTDLLHKDGACSHLKGGRPKTFAPATDAQIKQCEERLGGKLPASYIEFLRHTNGMVGYQGMFTFAGGGNPESDKAIRDIEKRRKLWVSDWESEHGKSTDAGIAKYEKKMNLSKETDLEAQIYVGNKLIFGTDFEDSLFFFLQARNSTAKIGEPNVIWRDNGGGIVVYKNFTEMLQRDIKILKMSAEDD